MTPARALVAALAAATAFSAARGDRRILAYLAVVLVVTAGLHRAHRLRPFPPVLQWAAVGCAALHLAGGLLPGDPVFYETWVVEGVVKYDQLVHFTISATLTAVARHVLGRWLEAAPPALLVAMAVLVANGFGAGNEVFEFLSALRFADAYVGGFENAGWDLVFNAFGSLTAGAVLLGAHRVPDDPTPDFGGDFATF